MTHPYRIAAARPVSVSRSWWRNALRLWRVQRAWEVRGWGRFLGAMVAAFAVWQTTRLALSPARGSALELATAVLSWPVADMLLGYLRLRRVRRAMRTQRVHVAPIHWGLAYTAHLSRCGRCTTAEPRCRTGRMLRAGRIERDGVLVTATTFPTIAAYRELARTGDVEAFAAKDLRPVTVEYTLQAMDYAEAARTIVITPPDAAIKATVIVLTDDERRGLTTNLDELGAVK